MARSKLNPHFWSKDGKLNPEVRSAIVSTVRDFVRSSDVVKPPMIKDIVLTGPMTNSTWNKASSLEVYVVFDYRDIEENTNVIEPFLARLANTFNANKKSVFGHRVNCTYKDISMNPSSTAYSIFSNQWTAAPRDSISIDRNYARSIFSHFVDRIKRLKNKEQAPIQECKELLQDVNALRTAGNTGSGRKFSNELFVFKKLQKKNWIKLLNRIHDTAYKQMSINESLDEKIDRLLVEKYVHVEKKRHLNRNTIGSANKFQYAVAKLHRKDNRKNNKVEELKRKKSGVLLLDDEELPKIKSDYNIGDLAPDYPRNLGKTGITVRYSPSLKVYYLIKQHTQPIRRTPVNKVNQTKKEKI